MSDRAQTGIYQVFSLDNPLPVLYDPDDPAIVRRLGLLIKIRYSISKFIDAILYGAWYSAAQLTHDHVSRGHIWVTSTLRELPTRGHGSVHGHNILHQCSLYIISGWTNLVDFSTNRKASGGEKPTKEIHGANGHSVGAFKELNLSDLFRLHPGSKAG
ncbi:hypothetical protein K438DRAFT_1748424 [Mycena galopus ATCC 62051]|nr:hypothetical protein K438DRAFT_1748424 [Mycena galopus ATCC 62051]